MRESKVEVVGYAKNHNEWFCVPCAEEWYGEGLEEVAHVAEQSADSVPWVKSGMPIRADYPVSYPQYCRECGNLICCSLSQLGVFMVIGAWCDHLRGDRGLVGGEGLREWVDVFGSDVASYLQNNLPVGYVALMNAVYGSEGTKWLLDIITEELEKDEDD